MVRNAWPNPSSNSKASSSKRSPIPPASASSRSSPKANSPSVNSSPRLASRPPTSPNSSASAAGPASSPPEKAATTSTTDSPTVASPASSNSPTRSSSTTSPKHATNSPRSPERRRPPTRQHHRTCLRGRPNARGSTDPRPGSLSDTSTITQSRAHGNNAATPARQNRFPGERAARPDTGSGHGAGVHGSPVDRLEWAGIGAKVGLEHLDLVLAHLDRLDKECPMQGLRTGRGGERAVVADRAAVCGQQARGIHGRRQRLGLAFAGRGGRQNRP